MNATAIAFRIKKIREFRNYTQRYLASKLNIKQNTYSVIERGAIKLSEVRLEKIAEVLEVPISLLLSDDLNLFAFDNASSSDSLSGIEPAQKMIQILQDEIHFLRRQNTELLQQYDALMRIFENR